MRFLVKQILAAHELGLMFERGVPSGTKILKLDTLYWQVQTQMLLTDYFHVLHENNCGGILNATAIDNYNRWRPPIDLIMVNCDVVVKNVQSNGSNNF